MKFSKPCMNASRVEQASEIEIFSWHEPNNYHRTTFDLALVSFIEYIRTKGERYRTGQWCHKYYFRGLLNSTAVCTKLFESYLQSFTTIPISPFWEFLILLFCNKTQAHLNSNFLDSQILLLILIKFWFAQLDKHGLDMCGLVLNVHLTYKKGVTINFFLTFKLH